MGATASIDQPETVWKLVDEIRAANPGNRCVKYLTKEYYDSLSPEQQAVFQKCVRTGIDNASSGLGCYAMQPSDYETFGAFFDQVRVFVFFCIFLCLSLLFSLRLLFSSSFIYFFSVLRKKIKIKNPTPTLKKMLRPKNVEALPLSTRVSAANTAFPPFPSHARVVSAVCSILC